MIGKLDLRQIRPALRALAQETFNERDGRALFGYAPSRSPLGFVAGNASLLRQRGICEEALLAAFVRTGTNNRGFTESDLRECSKPRTATGSGRPASRSPTTGRSGSSSPSRATGGPGEYAATHGPTRLTWEVRSRRESSPGSSEAVASDVDAGAVLVYDDSRLERELV
jgi:hypothetical protein